MSILLGFLTEHFKNTIDLEPMCEENCYLVL